MYIVQRQILKVVDNWSIISTALATLLNLPGPQINWKQTLHTFNVKKINDVCGSNPGGDMHICWASCAAGDSTGQVESEGDGESQGTEEFAH